MCKLNAGSTLTNSISREIRMGNAFPNTTTVTIYSATPDSQVIAQMDLNASCQMGPVALFSPQCSLSTRCEVHPIYPGMVGIPLTHDVGIGIHLVHDFTYRRGTRNAKLARQQ